MIHKTSTRRRWAALTSGALIAGGLVAAPAVAGLSAASAASVELGYTCTVVGGGQTVPQASTIDIDLTVPASVAPGAEAPVSLMATIDMGSAAFGPIQSLAGPFSIPITVGGETTSIAIPSSSAPVGDLVFSGTGTGGLTAPDAAGAAPITVGTITGALKTTPFDADTVATCLPDVDQDQTIGSLNVAEDEPEVLAYTCTIEGGGFTIPREALVEVDLTSPDSAEAGSELPVEVEATIDMGSGSIGPMQSFEGPFDLSFSVGDEVSDIGISSSSAPVDDMVFSGSGAGDLAVPDLVGAAAINLGTVTGYLTTTPFAQSMVVPCVPHEDQDLTVGSVDVEEASAPVAVPVDGKVKITGKAKVGKTLKAVPGKASGAKVSYKWLANGKAIKKATSKKLKLAKAHGGKKVKVKVTYTKSGYTKVVQTSKAVKVKKK